MNAEQGQWHGTVLPVDEPAAPRRRRGLVVFAVVAIVAVLVGAWFLMHGRAKPPVAVPQMPTVTVIVPGRTAVTDTITANGTLSAKRQMPVGVAGDGGMISRVLVDAGDWVRAGAVLATVDPAVQAAQAGQSRAQIAAAEANAKLAQSQLDRALKLVGRGFISKSDIDSRTATRDAANAQVELAHAQYREQTARLGRLEIRAPAAGLVLTRGVEPGQIVSAGSSALFNIAMGGEMELRARLAEQDLARVHTGMPAGVRPVGGTQAFTGRVWQVSPIIDAVSRQGEVRVQLAYSSALRPGGFATATFGADPRQAPVLPESAVMSDPKGANYVYLVDASDRIVRRDVTVGDVSDAGVAVLTGLVGNERVVYSAGAFLNVGDKVIPGRKAAS